MKANTFFINLLKRRGNPLYNLKEYLIKDNGTNYNKVVGFLKKDPKLREVIYDSLFPNIINNNYPTYLESLPLFKIIAWYCNILIEHSEVICDFESAKMQFERQFLANNYKESFEILEEIKEKFGLSLWLIDCYGLIDTFGDLSFNFEKSMHEKTLNWYKVLKNKNRKNERYHQYKYRINHWLANSNEQISTYYKYKLFAEMPYCCNVDKINENWKNVLLMEGGQSLIDIYLVTIDCLQYYVNSPMKTQLNLLEDCVKLISKIDTPICRIITSAFFSKEEENTKDNLVNQYVLLFEQKEYLKVVQIFLNDDYWYTCFNAYIYTAVAALHTDCDLETKNNCLGREILSHIYNVLSKSDANLIDEAILYLTSISKALRSFNIHKGICVFLDSQINIGINYFFEQQVTSYEDKILLSHELNNTLPELSPYGILYMKTNNYEDDEETRKYKSAIDNGVAVGYYKAALINTQIYKFIERKEFAQAISSFFYAYVNNRFFIYCIDVTKIREYLHNKIKKQATLELEELCYIFIDPEYKNIRKSCFLNFIDDVNLAKPLDIIKTEHYNEKAISFFLCNICTIEMLNSLYMLFESSDEAKDYRIMICGYLLNNTTLHDKELKIEIEELTKNKAMRQRLLNVDRSRVSINTISIKESIYEDVEYQVDTCNSQVSGEIETQKDEKYFILNPKLAAYSCLYDTYAKAFCFSQSGLDTSLSTRVRHGAFINQIFRTFIENSLIYSDNKSKNFFDTQFEKGKIKESLKPFLNQFHAEVQKKLQYFTQHTLKVFVDNPIEGAVFDYSAGYQDSVRLNIAFTQRLLRGTTMNTNDAIDLLHELFIDKTSEYLNEIRTVYLPKLEENLLSLLTAFSSECGKHATDVVTKKELRSMIAKCKTDLQSEFKTVKDWFYLSEDEQWEDYEFSDLIEMCIEITKKLFSGFDKVRISKTIEDEFIYAGKTFGINTDIILILLNNAFLHSGFEQKENNLHINCEIKSDSKYIYFAVENNFSDTINVSELSEKINKINDDYSNAVYKTVNTRQEGGMGLFKIMNILYSITKTNDSFYISMKDHTVRVEIKLRKDLVCCEENTTS